MSIGDDILAALEVDERPWGEFEKFVENQHVTVKIITVRAGRRLSLQRHEHRAELWRALDNPLTAEVDGDLRVLEAGDTVFIEQGAVHRLGNTGDRSGRILEIAFGEFDEADIERLEDDFSR
jgi:mannose-6-phosphate isomerase-like protein (cupin superfamily)